MLWVLKRSPSEALLLFTKHMFSWRNKKKVDNLGLKRRVLSRARGEKNKKIQKLFGCHLIQSYQYAPKQNKTREAFT